MKDEPSDQSNWLSDLPAPYNDYLSFDEISLGRHPSAFLIYQHDCKFIKKIPEQTKQIEYSVLCWLEQIHRPIKDNLYNPPKELILPKPEFLPLRSDLLITSKIAGHQISKSDLLINTTTISRILTYIHNLNKHENLPNTVMSDQNSLPIQFNDIETTLPDELKTQFKAAQSNIENSVSYVSFVHGDLTQGNILIAGSNIGLIDWEYAALRDCRWDLATLSIEFELTESEFENLCRCYQKQRGLKDNHFIEVAKNWLVIYSFTCLHWSKQHNQSTNKYTKFLQQLSC